MSYYGEDQIAQDRVVKQQYLKSEIIEKGYDGAQFGEYLESVKPDGGSDVDVWSIDELKGLVSQFKNWVLQQASQPAPEEHPVDNTANESQIYPQFDNPFDQHNSPVLNNNAPVLTDSKFHQQNDQAIQNAAPKQSFPQSQKIEETKADLIPGLPSAVTESKTYRRESADFKGSDGKDKEEVYSSTLNVKLAETTQLRDGKNMEISVHGYEQTKSGLFSITHTNYLVKTLPYGWDVKRRYSDFFWLRSTLQRLHPGVMIPPIPKKKNKNKAKPDFLRKRMYFLQRFLNACALNDELRGDKFYFAFLHLSNDSQYKNIKKEADKKPRYHRIKDIATLSGQVPIEINRDLKLHAQSMAEFCTQTDPIYSKIRKLGKQLIHDFTQVSNTLLSLGECYAGLYSASTNFNKTTEAGKNLHLEDIYLTMNNIMVAWAQQTVSQNENIQKHFTHFYKYAQYENEAFKEVLEVRTKTGLDYLQRKTDLFAKKEKLFQQKDVTKWEISPKAKDIPKEHLFQDKKLAFDVMLYKESAALHEIRTNFGYYNAMSYSELESALREKCRQYAQNFHEFGIQQADIMNQVQTKWAEFLVHFMDTNIPEGGNQREILTRASIAGGSNDPNMTHYDDD